MGSRVGQAQGGAVAGVSAGDGLSGLTSDLRCSPALAPPGGACVFVMHRCWEVAGRWGRPSQGSCHVAKAGGAERDVGAIAANGLPTRGVCTSALKGLRP